MTRDVKRSVKGAVRRKIYTKAKAVVKKRPVGTEAGAVVAAKKAAPAAGRFLPAVKKAARGAGALGAITAAFVGTQALLGAGEKRRIQKEVEGRLGATEKAIKRKLTPRERALLTEQHTAHIRQQRATLFTK